MYNKIAELVTAAEESGKPISELMLLQEMAKSHRTRTEIWEQMRNNYHVMKAAVEKGLAGDGVFSPTGLTGGEAVKLRNYRQRGNTLSRRRPADCGGERHRHERSQRFVGHHLRHTDCRLIGDFARCDVRHQG